MTEQLSLAVTATPETLQGIVAEIEAMAARENWSPDLVFKVNLVLEELVLNIGQHGAGSGENAAGVIQVEIRLGSEPDRLVFEIVDDGTPFDPLHDAPQPDLEAALEDRRVGGLGLHLVRSVVDGMEYKCAAGKNHLTLIARRGG